MPKIGDRIEWSNDYGQTFDGPVVGVHGSILFVKRPEWIGTDLIDAATQIYRVLPDPATDTSLCDLTERPE